MKKFRALGFLLILFIPLWLFIIAPVLTVIPQDFSYKAEVFSLDNFYSPEKAAYIGQQISKTVFSYDLVKEENGVLIIRSIFVVRTLTGDKIFSVERL